MELDNSYFKMLTVIIFLSTNIFNSTSKDISDENSNNLQTTSDTNSVNINEISKYSINNEENQSKQNNILKLEPKSTQMDFKEYNNDNHNNKEVVDQKPDEKTTIPLNIKTALNLSQKPIQPKNQQIINKVNTINKTTMQTAIPIINKSPLVPITPKPVSEVEKAERLHRGVEKMIQFVSIMGQIDSFLSERTKSMMRKLSILADDDDDYRYRRSSYRKRY